MPIKGMTRREDITPRFTRLGKIKKGEFSNGRPVDLDYFRFVGEGSRASEIEQVWFDSFGNEPTTLRVYLPYKTADENWETWQELWSEKQGLIHRCDSETMVQWLDSDTLEYHRDTKPCPYHTGELERTKKKPGCKPVGRLAIIIPEFLRAGYAGYVTLEVHSINDIANITASLYDAEGKSAAAGRHTGLQGIEFDLRRVPEEIGVRFQNKAGDTVKTKATKWMIRLDPAVTWVLNQIETVSNIALGVHEQPALPAPEFIDAEIVDETEDEEEKEETIILNGSQYAISDLEPATLAWVIANRESHADVARERLAEIAESCDMPKGVGFDDIYLVADASNDDLSVLLANTDTDKHLAAVARFVVNSRNAEAKE